MFSVVGWCICWDVMAYGCNKNQLQLFSCDHWRRRCDEDVIHHLLSVLGYGYIYFLH